MQVNSNKHIIEKIVRQVGHLPELYEDARSEKYKIYVNSILARSRVTYVATVMMDNSTCI
jgi:hypothetical protein